MNDLHNDFREANSPESSSDDLKKLALHDDEIVRASVVHNSNKPISVIEILFNDKSPHVQEALFMQGLPTGPKIIQVNELSGYRINLRNVSSKDAEFIVSLRADEKKSKYISKTSHDVEDQIKWIESYLSSDGQAYFIIEDKFNNPLGTIRAYDQQEDSFCWGSWITIKSAPDYASIESALILYTFMLKIGFKKSHFEVRKGNDSVRKFHERFGAKITAESEKEVLYSITESEIQKSLTRFKKMLPNGINITP